MTPTESRMALKTLTRLGHAQDAISVASVVCVLALLVLLSVATSALWPPRALDTSVDTGPR